MSEKDINIENTTYDLYDDHDNIEIITTLNRDTDLDGELKFETPLKICGKFKGKIITNSFVWVDSDAEVYADIYAGSVRLGGFVKGNIEAKYKIEMLSNARLFGNIKTSKVKMYDGVVFEGTCEMTK